MISFLRAAAALLACGCAAAGGRFEPEIAATFQPVAADAPFPVGVPSAFGSTRGYLVVPENPRDPASPSVRLPVAVVKAKEPSGKPPVVFVIGGPGAGSLAPAAYPGDYPWTADRDFIVYGRRGTTQAEPSLACPEFAEALEDDGDVAARADAAAACSARLRGSGVDISQYSTAAHARDLEALRVALGYDRLSLFALSYGTRLALAYARDYPDAVEALALTSPLPFGADFDAEFPESYRASLAAIAAACAAEGTCAADLGERYFAAVDAAKAEPWRTEREGREALTASAADLAAVADPSSRSGIDAAPALMEAVASRDEKTIAARLGGGGTSDFDWGVRLSIWCSEALAYSPRRKSPIKESFAGLDGAVFDPAICAAWGAPKRPRREVAPTISDVPTLIIAGEYDPLTPPK